MPAAFVRSPFTVPGKRLQTRADARRASDALTAPMGLRRSSPAPVAAPRYARGPGTYVAPRPENLRRRGNRGRNYPGAASLFETLSY